MLRESAKDWRNRRRMSSVGILWCALLISAIFFFGIALTDNPRPFDGPIFLKVMSNVTVPIGREAVLECLVENLSTYKVAWLRITTQTILTIANHVITKNNRISVGHSDHKTWNLHIREVKELDAGAYMCQINTDPMKSQITYLDVVVPPDILDQSTSTDMVVDEGQNVTMKCNASGTPHPNITWRREASERIPLGDGREVTSVEGPTFNITKVNRLHMGAYLCIASNGVPPSVSKRIMLIVNFAPVIGVQNQSVGAEIGHNASLECHVEAYPKSINYWAHENDVTITNSDKYTATATTGSSYKLVMKLLITSVEHSDYETYRCLARNPLGIADGSVKLHFVPTPTTEPPTTTTTTTMMTTTLSTTTTTTMTSAVTRGERKQKSQQKLSPSSKLNSLNENVGVKTAYNREDTRHRNKGKYDITIVGGALGNMSSKSLNNNIQTDKTAQSMSASTSSAILSFKFYVSKNILGLCIFIIFGNS